jgi:benzoate/toluate 1,2-dioxygenase subunit alpha
VNLSDLVRPDRVSGRVYTDAGLFELEREKLFARAWLYAGHISQFAHTGAYRVVRLAGQSVLLVRQADGGVAALANRCAHKGMQLFPEDAAGVAPAIRCGYHGWVYGPDGRLRSRPGEAGFEAGGLCKTNPAASLASAGEVADYRGFLFARLRPGGASLLEWLGPMRASLDNFVDRAPAGEIEAVGAPLVYRHVANWKFFAENTLDALHPQVVHASATQPAQKLNAEKPDPTLAMLLPFASPVSFFDAAGQRCAPFGHGELGVRHSMHSADSVDPDYWAALCSAYGADRARAILEYSPNNTLLYPSVMLKPAVSLVRVIEPVAVDQTILRTWHFRLKGAPDALMARTAQYSTLVNSPAGAVGPDDHEAYRRLQAALSEPGAWAQMGRHLTTHGPEPGTSDAVYRNQFAAWRAALEAA